MLGQNKAYHRGSRGSHLEEKGRSLLSRLSVLIRALKHSREKIPENKKNQEHIPKKNIEEWREPLSHKRAISFARERQSPPVQIGPGLPNRWRTQGKWYRLVKRESHPRKRNTSSNQSPPLGKKSHFRPWSYPKKAEREGKKTALPRKKSSWESSKNMVFY